MSKIKIVPASPEQASEIAWLIMEAMNHACCLHFAGPDHTLEQFHDMMVELVSREDSQYSYRNTLVAMAPRRQLAGICVCYDGKDLRRLRQSFYEAGERLLGRHWEGMADETCAGEYYIDSLAVKQKYRHQGIAHMLLRTVVRQQAGRQPVALLVDQGNPQAEKLYRSVGFEPVEETVWGGHLMRRMRYRVKCEWALGDDLSEEYHDREWGVPVHDERQHYMYLLMESMSCGLSWQMMLQRRDVFDRCFAHFDAARVACFSEEDIERILQTEGMIRSRRKVEGMIANAQAFVDVAREFGSFDKYIWGFTNGQSLIYSSHCDRWVTRNELSDRVAADMKRRGFKYVGSTIIYSHLQAIGIINDHHPECFRYQELLPGCTVVEE